jgi:NAD(P)-dependent dehydrogenase (short-subunit alcohol dehydrogenase family)
MNLFDLTGKVAVVTGSGGNLGPIWCDILSQYGARVIALDLPSFDVTKTTLKLSEPVDILVNNAAIDNPPGSVATLFGKFEEIMVVNIGGAVRMCGVIINVGSIQGSRGAVKRNYEGSFEKPVGYNCSKAALVQLSRSITTQYGDKDIRSVTIGFGPVDTPKLDKAFMERFLRDVPLGRPISKQSLQTTLLFACCCPELAGQLIMVDGGFCA